MCYMPHVAIVEIPSSIRYMYTMLQLACMYLQASMANVVLFYVHAQLAASLRLSLRFIGKANAVDVIDLRCQSSIWFDMAMLPDQD